MSDEHNLIVESWRTDKQRDAEVARNRRAKELENAGWKVDCLDAELVGANGFTVYSLEATI